MKNREIKVTIWTKLVQKLLLANDKSSNLLGIALAPLEQVVIWSFRNEDDCKLLGLPHLKNESNFTPEILRKEKRYRECYEELLNRGIERNISTLEAIKKDYDNRMEQMGTNPDKNS